MQIIKTTIKPLHAWEGKQTFLRNVTMAFNTNITATPAPEEVRVCPPKAICNPKDFFKM